MKVDLQGLRKRELFAGEGGTGGTELMNLRSLNTPCVAVGSREPWFDFPVSSLGNWEMLYLLVFKLGDPRG